MTSNITEEFFTPEVMKQIGKSYAALKRYNADAFIKAANMHYVIDLTPWLVSNEKVDNQKICTFITTNKKILYNGAEFMDNDDNLTPRRRYNTDIIFEELINCLSVALKSGKNTVYIPVRCCPQMECPEATFRWYTLDSISKSLAIPILKRNIKNGPVPTD